MEPQIKKRIIIASLLLLLLSSTAVVAKLTIFSPSKKTQGGFQKISTFSPTATPSLAPQKSEPTNSPSPTKKPTPVPTSTPKPTLVPTVTPTPVVYINPTCFNPVAYPSTNGETPFTVGLTPGGKAGTNSIAGYQWDFEADGNWDTEVSPNAVNRTYTNPGNYTINMRVQDTQGHWSSICSIGITVSSPLNGSISGLTYNDTNHNGQQDSGETGIHFSKINLYKEGTSGAISGIGSETDGTYLITGLSSGSYIVQAENPAGQYTVYGNTSQTVNLNSSSPNISGINFGVTQNY